MNLYKTGSNLILLQNAPTKKKSLGSYPFLSVVFSITLALTVIGLFSTVILHAKNLSEYFKKNIQLHVYLNNNVNEHQLIRIKSLIATKPYLLKEDGDIAIKYISKEQAVVNFIQETGEDFTEILGVNPLRPSLIIKIDPDYSEINSLLTIKDKIEQVDGVFEVDLNSHKENEIRSINENINKVLYFLAGFTILALFTIVMLINNTIKIALFSQRFLIRSMQLIGATAGFIQWPFIKNAMFQGFAAGLLASLSISSVLQYIYADITELQDIINYNQLFLLLGIIPFLGLLISTLSSYLVINKYLKLSLDELY